LYIGCSKDWPNYLRSKGYRQWWQSCYKVFRTDLDEDKSQDSNDNAKDDVDGGDGDNIEDEAGVDNDDDEARVNKDAEDKADDDAEDDDKDHEDKGDNNDVEGGKDDGDDNKGDNDEDSGDEEEDSVAQKPTQDEGKKPKATKRILKTKTGAPHKPVSMPKACCHILNSKFELTHASLAVVLSSEMFFILYWTKWEDEHETGSRMDSGRNSSV